MPRQGSPGQTFCARDVGSGRVSHSIHRPAGERARQPALRLDGVRIERQRALKHADRFRTGVACLRLRLRPKLVAEESFLTWTDDGLAASSGE
jgi:hypothetical protein